MNNEIAQIRHELLVWAGLHRGKAISEEAMPEFHRIIDRLEQLAKISKPLVQIDRVDGSCPVQATGTIDDHSAFYFRGRHEKWQFIAGPKELSTDDLIRVQLKMTTNDRVFVLEGDDEEPRDYQLYDHVRKVLQDYAQQYVEWMNESRN